MGKLKLPLRVGFEHNLIDAEGKVICTAGPSACSSEEDIAHLEELARAANAFESLRDACKESLRKINFRLAYKDLPTAKELTDWIACLQNALSLAEGKESHP